MKKIFKGHFPWGFLGFRHANAENQEWHRYLTGYTPVKKIHKAASMGDITQVQRMLEFGDVDVNITDRKKRTALHYACAYGQAEMVTLLLWYDCNIEARDSDKSTALIKAAQRRHEGCVKILLENGADSNAIDANQNTALHYAVYNNNTAIAAKLLAFRADTEIKAKNGYTPLILAVLENKQEMVELLLRSAANVNALDNYNRSALIHAVRAQSKDMISLLLQQGADVSLVDVYGATAQSYTIFETFQVLSKGYHSSTTGEDRYNSNAKEDCISCAHSTQDGERMAQLPAKEEGNRDAADKLGSQVTLENQEEEPEPCKDCDSKGDTCPSYYSKASLAHTPTTSKPTTEDDENSVNSKTPVVLSPLLTESSLWIGYPEDRPKPMKFSRQPAVYKPIEWRKDMESQSVPLEENKQPVVVSPGNEANVQTHTQPARYRVFEEPDAKDSDPTEKEDAKTPVVLSPLLTESSLWIGYPEDRPKPMKFSRQPAVYKPIEWRKDMESQSVPLEENKQPVVVSPGNEANVQTHTQPARYRSVSGLCMKEIKKTERETWTPRQPVITPVFEKSLPEAAGLLLVKEDHHLSEMAQDEGRLTKRQAKEKHKMATQVNQVNEMKEANSLSQPSATAPGNDSSSLLKLWDMIHSYERLMEIKNCGLLTGKRENMENRASGVQREETEIKSWLQHKGGEREDLCTLRFPLKQGEKQGHAECMFQQGHAECMFQQGHAECMFQQGHAECMFQQKKIRLSRKEEQYCENMEQTPHPEIRKMIADAKAIENNLRQLQGLQDQLSETAQTSGKMQASLQRLEIRLSKLKITLREQSARLQHIQNQLLHEDLLGDETKKLVQQTQSLERTLEKQMDKNEELMMELAGFKKLFEETKKKLNKHEGRELTGPGDLKNSQFDIPISTLRHEFYKLRETWETTYYKYLHTVVKLQFMEQELAAIKSEQKKCGCLLQSHKNLEEEVLHCRSWMREHAIQARDQNNTKDLRDADEVVTISEMELRIKSLESQLATRGAQRSLPERVLPSEHHCAGERAMTQPLRRELGEQASRSPQK